MVVRAVLLITFIGHAEHRVGSIQPNAPLETAGRHVPAVTLHQHLVDQVFLALMEMGEAVYLFARERRPYPEKRSTLVIVSAIEGRRYRSNGGRDEGMIRQCPHFLAQDVGFEMELLKGGHVFGPCSHGHLLVLLLPNVTSTTLSTGLAPRVIVSVILSFCPWELAARQRGGQRAAGVGTP
jgi:hypothetical protein